MSFRTFKQVIVGFLIALVLPAAALAEAGPKVIPEASELVKEGTQPGWNPVLRASANLALGNNDNVPGNQDGLSLQFGYLINAGFGFLNDTREHEWVTTLFWQLGYARTPAVDVLLKSVDTIDFKTSYLYHIPQVPWLGVFGAFRLSAPMLPSYDARGAATDVIRLKVGETQQFDAAGNLVDETGAVINANHPRVQHYDSGKKIALTGAFAPLILRESAGLFAVPIDKSWMRIDMRLGFGAWETFVRHGFTVQDNAATANFLELQHFRPWMLPQIGVRKQKG